MTQQPGHVQTGHPQRKLGRLPNDPDKKRLLLGSFLKAGYTGTVPATVDYSAQVKTWPMAKNDVLGDCTAADACHQEQVWSTYGQGATFTPSDDDVLAFYEGATGYNPADPSTDEGGVMQDVCTYWRKTGIAGRKIAAFFEVNPSDADELRTALYLFGGVGIGMDFPAFAMDQFNSGQQWDVAKRNTQIEGGHDVLLVGMNKGGNYVVVTWGQLQQVTPAFWKKYMAGRDGEAWCRVSTDWVRNNASPEGLDVASLNAAFMQITGEPGPFPQAAPQPVTPPTNPPPVTPPGQDVDLELATSMRLWLAAKKL